MALNLEEARVQHAQIEGAALAKEIELLEAALKQAKNKLKTIVETYGEVCTETSIWGFTTSQSWKFTPEKLKALATDILIETGQNPWNFLSITSNDLKKLQYTDEKLSQYGTKKESKSFRSRSK